MAVTNDQYNRILGRLTALENMMNDVAVAMDKFITLSQMNQLLTMLQTDLDDVKTTVEALENRVSDIESEPSN